MKFAYLIEPPFNYRTEDGQITGSDIELAKYVSKKIEQEPFDPIEAEFAELLPRLADGDWDMTTGLFGTKERQEIASFSRPIWALPDGLLVKQGNPKQLNGYKSIAKNTECKLAVIRDQFQHRSAVEFGIAGDRIEIFETYTAAAQAVLDGFVDAYASVGRAHAGFLEQNRDWALEILPVPASEKEPAFGSFGFALKNNDLREKVDKVLAEYLGSEAHRIMMAKFGFRDDEIDLVAS